ncbi:MAG: hypothetical protein AABW99_01575 [archaeon]
MIGFVFLDIFELFGDINLILKIFVLMTIASWVKNHVGGGPVSWIIMAGMGYFILFDGWKIFGPIYVLYMMLMFGVSAIIIDFFFVTAGGAPKPESLEGMESPVSSGVDMAKRMAQHGAMQAARRPLRR